MSHLTDLNRLLTNTNDLLDKVLATHTIGLEIEEYEGSTRADMAPTGAVKRIGGQYSPVANTYVAPPDYYPLRLKASPIQFQALDFTNRIVCIFSGQRCLAEGTLVATPTGPRKIEELKVGDMVYGYEYGELTPTPIVAVHNQGIQDVVDITRYDKVIATSTLNHRWLIVPQTTAAEPEVMSVAELSARYSWKHRRVATAVIKAPLGEVDEPHAYALGAMNVKIGAETRKAPCYDISIANGTNLYALANGMITHNSGKSVAGKLITYTTLLAKPDQKVIYLVPKFAKSGIIEQDIERDLAPWIVKHDRSQHYIELINGSTIRIFSLSDKVQRESFLGYECNTMCWEESRESSSEVFKSAFSRLISTDGRMYLISSPETGHIIEDLANGEYNEIADVGLIELSTVDNFFIYENEEQKAKILKEAKSIYDPGKYDRDILGKFTNLAGQDYPTFSTSKHVVERPMGHDVTQELFASDMWLRNSPSYKGRGTVRPNPQLDNGNIRFLVGMDFGSTQMNCVVGKLIIPYGLDPDKELTWDNTAIQIIAELHQENTSCVQFAKEVLKPNGLTPDNCVIVGDPSGKARDHVVGESPFQFLMRLGYMCFPMTSSGRRRPTSTASLRQAFHLDKVLIDKKCKGVIKAILAMKSAGRSNDVIGKDPASHYTDCLRYLVHTLYPERHILIDNDKLDLVLKSYEK